MGYAPRRQTWREWANENSGAVNLAKIVVGAMLAALASVFVAGGTWILLTRDVQAQGRRLEVVEAKQQQTTHEVHQLGRDLERGLLNAYWACVGGARSGAYSEGACERPPVR